MAKKDRDAERITADDVGDVSVGEDGKISPESRGVAMDKAASTAVGKVGGYAQEDLGSGFEDFDQSDVQIPFLALLQKGSPQVEEAAPTFVPGAKPSMAMNTVTQELYSTKDGVVFVPVHREHKYIEWVPRDDGGGLAGVHEPESNLVIEAKANAEEFGKITLPNGNNLAETYTIFGLNLKMGPRDPALKLEDYLQRVAEADFDNVCLSFASTQSKAYKKWKTQAMSCVVRGEGGVRRPLPMYAHVYRLRTILDSNAKGTWF
jgi:hypothetical protein